MCWCVRASRYFLARPKSMMYTRFPFLPRPIRKLSGFTSRWMKFLEWMYSMRLICRAQVRQRFTKASGSAAGSTNCSDQQKTTTWHGHGDTNTQPHVHIITLHAVRSALSLFPKLTEQQEIHSILQDLEQRKAMRTREGSRIYGDRTWQGDDPWL